MIFDFKVRVSSHLLNGYKIIWLAYMRTPKYICRGQGTKIFFTNSCTHFFQGRNYDNVSQLLKKEINFWPTLQKLSKKGKIYMIFLVCCTQTQTRILPKYRNIHKRRST